MNFRLLLKMDVPEKENAMNLIRNEPDQKSKRIFFSFFLKCDFVFSTICTCRYKQKKPPIKPSCFHRCKQLQCRSLKDEDIVKFANGFYESKDKPGQDSFILMYCSVEPPTRTNRSVKNGSRKQVSIECTIRRVNGRLVKVCQKAFRGILKCWEISNSTCM